MVSVDLVEAEKLVCLIKDVEKNPQAASDATLVRDKWIFENDHGTLYLSPQVVAILESA